MNALGMELRGCPVTWARVDCDEHGDWHLSDAEVGDRMATPDELVEIEHHHPEAFWTLVEDTIIADGETGVTL